MNPTHAIRVSCCIHMGCTTPVEFRLRSFCCTLEKIIEEVKDYPVLYETSLEDCMGTKLKNELY